jgi:hypothetical protein
VRPRPGNPWWATVEGPVVRGSWHGLCSRFTMVTFGGWATVNASPRRSFGRATASRPCWPSGLDFRVWSDSRAIDSVSAFCCVSSGWVIVSGLGLTYSGSLVVGEAAGEGTVNAVTALIVSSCLCAAARRG